jgi:hypothetical protein
MFRIVCDPSSGNNELCLTGISLSGSQIFFVCLVGVWQRDFEPAVCVCTVRRAGNQPVVPCTHTAGLNYAVEHRPSTRKISVNH